MTNPIRSPVVPFAAMLLLSACARPTGGGYPSLAPRPIEKTSFADPAPSPVPSATPDPALDTVIAAANLQLTTIAKGFAADAVKAAAASRAAKGQAAGSDRWLDAQTALGSLDQWHAQISALATDTEERAIERASMLAPPYPALTALQARIETENAVEATSIARAQASLAPA
ncbi:hypothetical protein [Sphingomonas bacterium]|uniref:hypothetical protein n=1 Tax=Sphingomonas bacterium TaxID=1895847 RepID=UPI0020C73B8E|nr:hypothetical protein [Sphingomonas bacterium]